MKIALYRALPRPLREFSRWAYSLLPAGIRLGKTYRATKRFLADAQYWDRARIRQWQWEKMKDLLQLAFTHVRGYRLLYADAGVKLDDIRSLEDVHRLPFVDKEMLRDNLEDFTDQRVPAWKRLYRTTGGSTGIPFGFYLMQDNIERELAFLHSAWERVSWNVGTMSAVLRGAFIGSEQDFFSFDPLLNELLLSTYYLTGATYATYRRKLLELKPSVLQAYPSAANIFADLVIEREDTGMFPFHLLLLGSENLYNWQREKIRKAFPAAKQFSWYGHAEQVLFAPACESTEQFHLDPFYGYAEILNAADKEAGQGTMGELVGTSFWNLVTPMIRYRTMDVARRGTSGCGACGRQYDLLETIEGRLQEFIVTWSGRYISMTQLNMHDAVFDHVRQFQFFQQEAGKVMLRLVPREHFSDGDRIVIHKTISHKLGSDAELQIALVDRIETPQSGKFRFLIQQLPIKYGDAN